MIYKSLIDKLKNLDEYTPITNELCHEFLEEAVIAHITYVRQSTNVDYITALEDTKKCIDNALSNQIERVKKFGLTQVGKMKIFAL